MASRFVFVQLGTIGTPSGLQNYRGHAASEVPSIRLTCASVYFPLLCGTLTSGTGGGMHAFGSN